MFPPRISPVAVAAGAARLLVCCVVLSISGSPTKGGTGLAAAAAVGSGGGGGSGGGSKAAGLPPIIVEHPADVVVGRKEPATLNCGAEGSPPPSVTWYRDGAVVAKDGRILVPSWEGRVEVLPAGALFFVWVINTRRENDAGTYWCTARNLHGTARSRNATLEIAVLRDEFRERPSARRVAEGETVTLECAPPRGHPAPVITWMKDKTRIDFATQHRFRLVEEGTLVIVGTRRGDTGHYRCRASNVAGERETAPAFLQVLVPPHLTAPIQSQVVGVGATVELMCRVGGDPKPEVFWRREGDGQLPVDRLVHEEGGQVLRLQHVTLEDRGVYICEAENPVGKITANATLTVHAPPVITIQPKDVRVGVGGTATFDCVVAGSPPPTSYWRLASDTDVLTPGQDSRMGRVVVSRDNTLTVGSVVPEDEGFYTCVAVGPAGSAVASAYLDVRRVSEMPPPLISVAPPNMELPVGSEAELPCEAVGTPEPQVSWMKDGKPLETGSLDDRITLSPLGTLQIRGLKTKDSGTYECVASSETGRTSVTVQLQVLKSGARRSNFTPLSMPAAPSHLQAKAYNETTVHVQWQVGEKGTGVPLAGHTVLYWSPEERGGWKAAAATVHSASSAIVSSLKPDTHYVFVVRAQTTSGVTSRPSGVSEIVKTPPSRQGHRTREEDARRALATPSIRLMSVSPKSPTDVRLTWNILTATQDHVQGLYIRYRPLGERHSQAPMQVINVPLEQITESFELTGLLPGTTYQVFLVPYNGHVEGRPTRAKVVRTLEAAPAEPPDDIRVRRVNATAVSVSWQPLDHRTANGIVTGYDIKVSYPNETTAFNMTAAAGSWAIVSPLPEDMSFAVSVAAVTAQGRGPFSPPKPLTPDTSANPHDTPTTSFPVAHNWLLVLAISSVAAVVFIALAGTVLYIYRKRNISKCPHSSGKEEQLATWSDYPNGWGRIGVYSEKGSTARGSICGRPAMELPSSGTAGTLGGSSIGGGGGGTLGGSSLGGGGGGGSSGVVVGGAGGAGGSLRGMCETSEQYEEPDEGYRLVAFNNHRNLVTSSTATLEPYATTPLIDDSMTRSTGAGHTPKLTFPPPPPPPLRVEDSDSTMASGSSRSHSSGRRYLLKQLPLFSGAGGGGSSSGTSNRGTNSSPQSPGPETRHRILSSKDSTSHLPPIPSPPCPTAPDFPYGTSEGHGEGMDEGWHPPRGIVHHQPPSPHQRRVQAYMFQPQDSHAPTLIFQHPPLQQFHHQQQQQQQQHQQPQLHLLQQQQQVSSASPKLDPKGRQSPQSPEGDCECTDDTCSSCSSVYASAGNPALDMLTEAAWAEVVQLAGAGARKGRGIVANPQRPASPPYSTADSINPSSNLSRSRPQTQKQQQQQQQQRQCRKKHKTDTK